MQFKFLSFGISITVNMEYTNNQQRIVEEDTAQKMKFSIKDFFSKYDQIRRKLYTRIVGFLCQSEVSLQIQKPTKYYSKETPETGTFNIEIFHRKLIFCAERDR